MLPLHHFSIFSQHTVLGHGSKFSYSLSQSGIDINYFADFMYLDIVPLKPVSVPGILILEFGLAGLLFVIFLIIKSYRFILIFFKSLNF